jgi:hypothetical protein
MNHTIFYESLREQLQKVKAYKRHKATGETYEEALAAIQNEKD